ncbi:MAG: DUF3796 domain-containing protein [Bacteroidales bacterium]|jgi:hypothetical protein|nr:DUF3796 domain-containing protein [Bacteroidales bacterium]
MKNKLAYLGFIGLLGFGGFFGTPLIFAFFGFLGFFYYIKVVPDELFWTNVRKCATYGFFTFLIPACLIIVTTLMLQENENLFDYASTFALVGFALTMSASLGVFCATLEYLEKREKRSKEDGEED